MALDLRLRSKRSVMVLHTEKHLELTEAVKGITLSFQTK